MASPGVTLSGTIQDITGTGIAGTLVFTLCNFGDLPPQITGTSQIAPLKLSVTAAGNGAWSVTLWGNDQISPNTTYYQVQTIPAGATGPAWAVAYQLNSGTYDLSTQTPIITITPPPPFVLSVNKVQPSDHIQFVSPNGNDNNDGLSWTSAKLTAAAAFTAIGSNTG